MSSSGTWDELSSAMFNERGAVVSHSEYARLTDLSVLSLKKPVMSGSATLMAFFLVASAWATLTPITSVLMVPATVVSVDNVRSVMHQDGGSISSISVTEGAFVQAGDVILRLDGTALNAEMTELNLTIKQDSAILQRDNAERDERQLSGSRQRAHSGQSLDSAQEDILFNHMRVRRAKDELTTSNIAQNDEAVASLLRQLRSLATSKAAAEDDLRIARTLLATGSGSRVHFNQATRLVAQQQSEFEDLRSRLLSEAARRQLILSTHEQEAASEREATATERSQVERDLAANEAKKLILSAAINRLVVRAPIDGQVSLLTHKIVGESVSPGALLAEIAPDHERTIVVARVDTRYVGDIRTGQIAELKSYDANAARHARTLAKVLWKSKSSLEGKESTWQYRPVGLEVLASTDTVGSSFTQVGAAIQVAFTRQASSFLESLFQPTAIPPV